MARHALLRLTVALSALFALMTGASTAAASAAPGDQIGPTQIVNNSTGGNLVPHDYGNNHNDGIYMWALNYTSTGNMWTLEQVHGGFYLIRNSATGKCLKPGGTFYGKTYVTQGACNDSYEFQWQLQSRPFKDGVKIVSRSTHQAMQPYQNQSNQVVVLGPNSNTAINWWSLSGM